MDPDSEDTRIRAGDQIDTYINGIEMAARVLAVRNVPIDLALVEFQRPDGSTGLYEAPRDNPYYMLRRMPYRRLPNIWKAFMGVHKIPWLGLPKGPKGNKVSEPWR